MKKIIFGLIATVLIAGCVNGQANLLEFYSSDYGIRIMYPSNWEVNEGFMGTVVVFLSPKEGASDNFQENFNIVVQDLTEDPMSLSEYSELSLNQLQQYINDMDVFDYERDELDGNLAQKITYTGTQGEYNLKWLQIWSIRDNKAYIVTYSAEENKYSRYLGTINNMINSIEIE